MNQDQSIELLPSDFTCSLFDCMTEAIHPIILVRAGARGREGDPVSCKCLVASELGLSSFGKAEASLAGPML